MPEAHAPGISTRVELSQNPCGVKGKLRLRFESRAAIAGAKEARTVLVTCDEQAPLKVVRAFAIDDGGALVHLHNLSGGVLGGDQLETIVEVGAGARVQLTTTGATRIYRSRREAAAATQVADLRVSEDGLLEFLPDALIPFAGSRYRQETRIALASNAGLFWWETIAPGREARGEIFAYVLLQIKVDITAAGRLIARENIKLEPALRPLSSLARLGSFRYFSNLYICRVGQSAERWLSLERELGEMADQLSQTSETLWGVSTLPAHGLIVRALSCQGRDLAPGLLAFWRAAKRQLYGQEAVPPRKIY